MKILITGITGFFGRNFAKYLLQQNSEITIIGTAHSESKLAYFKKTFPKIKTYLIDLSCDIRDIFDNIVNTHKVEYIIHSAAMKHVDICQENPLVAYQVNALASDIIIKIAKKNNIKNLIAMSTDKSNNPCNTYGIVKYIMQENVLSNNYSVYQGANFFWSDGSVLDIWFNQYVKNLPLSIRNRDHIRYFNTIDHVCQKIYQNIDVSGKIILPDHVYVIKLGDLLDAFMEYFKYYKVEYIAENSYEKQIEILRDEINNKIYLSHSEIINFINNYYQNML